MEAAVQGGAMEVGKVVGTACLVDEDLLMETVSGRVVLGSSTKCVKRSSMMKTEPWPQDVGSGTWEATRGKAGTGSEEAEVERVAF